MRDFSQLKKRMRSYEEGELIRIISHERDEYHPEAVRMAEEELSRRGRSSDTIAELRLAKDRQEARREGHITMVIEEIKAAVIGVTIWEGVTFEETSWGPGGGRITAVAGMPKPRCDILPQLLSDTTLSEEARQEVREAVTRIANDSSCVPIATIPDGGVIMLGPTDSVIAIP